MCSSGAAPDFEVCVRIADIIEFFFTKTADEFIGFIMACVVASGFAANDIIK